MDAGAQQAFDVSGVEFERSLQSLADDFSKFQQLLIKWQQIQNLVSRETLDLFWTRHVADSLQILNYTSREESFYLDIGSGGGFPAIPLAIALKESGASFVLVESNSRKVAFLRAVARELELNLKVVDERIENFVSRETVAPQVITARAVAPLDELLDYAHPAWGEETRAFFHKGREHVEELAESHIRWHFNVVIRPSLIDQSGVVLEIANLRPKTG